MALKWRLFCPVAVFILSGLSVAGCTKEEKKFDVFNANEPKVVRAGGTVELKTWDRHTDRGLDLHDAFDVSNSNATHVKIVTLCNRGDYYLTNEFSSDKLKVIKIFQLVDQEFLTTDFSTKSIHCDFKITLSNAVGSRHIFPISPAPIRDANLGEVKIGENQIVGEKISENETVRFVSMNEGKISAVCDDMTTPQFWFRQVTEFKFFEFSRPILRKLRSENTILEKPLQNCRLAVFENDILVAVSKRFKKLIPRAPLHDLIEFHAPGDVIRADLTTYDYTPFFTRGVDKELFRVAYYNSLPVGRHIIVPKKNLPVIYETFSREKSQDSGLKFPVERDWIYLILHDRGGATIEEDSENWVVTLNPGPEKVGFAISVMAKAAPGLNCSPHGILTKAVLIYPNPNKPLEFTEVMQNREVLGTVSIKHEDKVMIGTDFDIRRDIVENAPLADRIHCTWPL